MTTEEIDRLVARAQRGEKQAFWDLILEVQQDVRLFIAVVSPVDSAPGVRLAPQV
jgi:hypothetical protein